MRIDFPSFRSPSPPKPKGPIFPVGCTVFKGPQGAGKTLSMVRYIFQMKERFPRCQVYSNLKLFGIKYHFIETDAHMKRAMSAHNGADGVLIALDEAHLYWGKKTGISLDVFTAFCQQRKDRFQFVFTCQIWEDLDVSLRKQVKNIVSCRELFGFFILLSYFDGSTLHWSNLDSAFVASHVRTELYKKTFSLCQSYDTYQKIVTNDQYQSLPSVPVVYTPSTSEPPSHRRSLFHKKK